MIELSDVKAAARRIAGHIRRTPLIRADQCAAPATEGELRLKLECLQPTGSFKTRGAINKLKTTPPERLANGIVTASGGNHGLAVARAAQLAGASATVFAPTTVSPEKVEKMRKWGADVRVGGSLWDEANREALVYAEHAGAVYFHPFADASVMAGQGTIGLEIIEDWPEVETILVAIGGGGLIAGLATAVKAMAPHVRIVGVEPVGSPTLQACLAAGEVVRLPAVTTRVATMACGKTDQANFDIVRRNVDEIVLVEDTDMLDAARWLWFEFGIAADLSGAASVAALRSGRVNARPGERVCGLVCGAGTEGMYAA